MSQVTSKKYALRAIWKDKCIYYDFKVATKIGGGYLCIFCDLGLDSFGIAR